MKQGVTGLPWTSIAVLLAGSHLLAQENRPTTRTSRAASLVAQLDDEALCQRATNALVRIGPAAVEELLAVVERGSSAEARKAPARRRALSVLGRLGPDATKAMPRLLRLARPGDEETDWDVLVVLGEIAPHAGAAQREAARDLICEHVRTDFKREEKEIFQAGRYQRIGRALSRCAVSASGKIPTLRRQLADLNPHIREAAAESLSGRGGEAAASLSWLVAAMNSTVPNRRCLVRFAGSSLTIRVSHAEVERIRLVFARAILAIGSDDDAVAQALAWLVLRGPREERQASLAKLAAMGEKAGSAVRILLRGLVEYEKPKSVGEIATTLGAIGGEAANEAIPTLEKLAMREDKRIAEPAKAALRRIKKD